MVIARTCINPKSDLKVADTFFYSSPIGKLKITATSKGICGIDFVSSVGKSSSKNPHIKKSVNQLDEYFSNKRESFDFPLDFHGTEFQMKVWRVLQKIPHGHTLSYSDIARKIKNPKAMRAVGLANNKNKVAIVIPCHRVIGKDGTLTGYAGGLGKKRWLLEHEKSS